MDDVEMELDLGEGLAPADDEIHFDTPHDTSDAPPPVAMDADPVPTKVHLRGLDEMTTRDIKAYVGEYFAEEIPDIEWIDDTSANLAFTSAAIASGALEALTQDITKDSHSALHHAKPATAKPGTELAVRLAVTTDRKKARGAADESRFYLMHPEHDPRERRRRRGGSDRRDGIRRRRRDGSHDEHARRQRFDDDDDEQMSGASDDNGQRRRRGGRRERDADRPQRSRSRSPMSRRDDNRGKELFSSGTRSAQTHAANAGKELFAARSAASSALAGDTSLPSASENGGGDGADAAASAPRELFPSRQRDHPGKSGGGSLFARITAPAPGSNHGSSSGGNAGGGMSIRGAAGLSIKGTSSQQQQETTERKLRELFPDKTRNRSKELMDRVTPAAAATGREGRTAERSRAETFY